MSGGCYNFFEKEVCFSRNLCYDDRKDYYGNL